MFLAVPCWISLLCCSSLTLPACFIPAGLSSVSLCSSMQGAMARVRGPFTPSQWIELEHQALIYKYLAANSPIPPSLLVPIRRSIASSPYPPSYFGTSTCKPSQEREEQKQSGRVLSGLVSFSSIMHIDMIKVVLIPSFFPNLDWRCCVLPQWGGGLSSWATPAMRIWSPGGAAGRTARNGGAPGTPSPTRSTASDI